MRHTRNEENVAKKCEIRVVYLLRLKSVPRLPGGGKGRAGAYSSIWGRNGHPHRYSGTSKGGLVTNRECDRLVDDNIADTNLDIFPAKIR